MVKLWHKTPQGWGGGKERCSRWDEMSQCDFRQKEEGSFPFPFPDMQPHCVPVPALLQVTPSHKPRLLADHPIPKPGEGSCSFPTLPVDRMIWQKDPTDARTGPEGNGSVLPETFWLKMTVHGSLNFPKAAVVLPPP